MQIPGVHIETLHNPIRYTYAQIEKACAIAAADEPGEAGPRRASEALATGDPDPDGEADRCQVAPRAELDGERWPGSDEDCRHGTITRTTAPGGREHGSTT